MKNYAPFPNVPAEAAETVLEPEDRAGDNWIGAPSVVEYDGETHLAVRQRTGQRGGFSVVVFRQSEPGSYEPVADVTNDELGVRSFGRPALVEDPRSGDLKLYVSVEDGGTWWIQKFADVPSPDRLNPDTAYDVLLPQSGSTDGAGVYDPYVITVGGQYVMFYAGDDGRSAQAHCATSPDGDRWTRLADSPVLPRQYWHDSHTRINCVFPARDAPVWRIVYDGSGVDDFGRGWDHRVGTAVSHDLNYVIDTSTAAPFPLSSTKQHADGSTALAPCRYVEVLPRDDAWEVFFEAPGGDDTFVLRRAEIDAPDA